MSQGSIFIYGLAVVHLYIQSLRTKVHATPKPVQFHHPYCPAKSVVCSLVTYTLAYRAGYPLKQVSGCLSFQSPVSLLSSVNVICNRYFTSHLSCTREFLVLFSIPNIFVYPERSPVPIFYSRCYYRARLQRPSGNLEKTTICTRNTTTTYWRKTKWELLSHPLANAIELLLPGFGED